MTQQQWQLWMILILNLDSRTHPRKNPVTKACDWKMSKINQGSRLMCCTSRTRSSVVDVPYARPTRRPKNGYSGSSSPSTLGIPLPNLRPDLFCCFEHNTNHSNVTIIQNIFYLIWFLLGCQTRNQIKDGL